MAKPHVRDYVDTGIRTAFDDSLDLDAALAATHANDHRWDYLLGHETSGRIVGLEPHTANNHEVSVVIKKRGAAVTHLRGQLKPGTTVARWFLVASGSVDFVPHEKKVLLLDQNGVTFVGRRLLAKHLL